MIVGFTLGPVGTKVISRIHETELSISLLLSMANTLISNPRILVLGYELYQTINTVCASGKKGILAIPYHRSKMLGLEFLD